MPTETIVGLFERDSHNPSMDAITAQLNNNRQPVDFCVPVNGYFPPPQLVDELTEALPRLLKYYPDYAPVHQKNLARITGLPADNIVVANGSTELITRLCVDSPGPLATCAPTFGRWTDLPMQQGDRLHLIKRRPADIFNLSVDRIVREVREAGCRKLVLCNPNNPTGAANPLHEIEAVADQLSDLDLIVIDESFIDFSEVASAAPLAVKRDNLIVVKSLGKSLGWHGIRLGYAVGSKRSANRLRGQVPYWNVNGIAAFVLDRLPGLHHQYRQSFDKVRQDRSNMFERLRANSSLQVYPSQANFLYLQLPDHVRGKALRNELLTRYGLLVRECSNKLGSSEQFLRIAVLSEPYCHDLEKALRATRASFVSASTQ